MVVVSSILLLDGIHKILEPEKDIDIVAESSAYLDVIPLIEQKKPDVLFLDSGLPNLDVVKILESIEEKGAKTKVLLLLHTLDEEAAINAISLGVRGYLTDASNAEQLVQAIKAVGRGEVWFAERKVLTKILVQLLPRRKAELVLKPRFTKKEEEIIKLVTQGYSNKQISNKLFMSEKTVKNHLGNIFNKLGIHSRLKLAINFLINIPQSSPRTKDPENSKNS
jgi:DNA-binding NarL/FixJ family response regulator